MPAAFKEDGPWTPADAGRPAAPRRVVGPTATRCSTICEARSQTANPTLAAAVARYDQARALAGRPTPACPADARRRRPRSPATASPNNRPLRGANQPDIYPATPSALSVGLRARPLGPGAQPGRRRPRRGPGQRRPTWRSVRLSLQAELADDYVRLRGLDAQAALLRRRGRRPTTARYDLTHDRFTGGARLRPRRRPRRDPAAATRAQVADVAAQRALIEHAIASLVGEPASQLLDPRGHRRRSPCRMRRRACPRPCCSAGPTSPRPSGAPPRPTPGSASRARPSSRASLWRPTAAGRTPAAPTCSAPGNTLLDAGPEAALDPVRRRPAQGARRGRPTPSSTRPAPTIAPWCCAPSRTSRTTWRCSTTWPRRPTTRPRRSRPPPHRGPGPDPLSAGRGQLPRRGHRPGRRPCRPSGVGLRSGPPPAGQRQPDPRARRRLDGRRSAHIADRRLGQPVRIEAAIAPWRA